MPCDSPCAAASRGSTPNRGGASAARFVDATDAQRRAILDDIAWPARAAPELSQGVAFFSDFRDLDRVPGSARAAMGVQDLRVPGQHLHPEWNGCPPAALAQAGRELRRRERARR